MDLTKLTLNLTSISNGTTTETPLGLASTLFGWTYALCWSSELYIRMFAWSQFTWQRFALYQFNGYIEYSLFNLIFLWNGGAEIFYSNLFPNGRIPVETYDAIYSCHYFLFLFCGLAGGCPRQSTYTTLNSGQEDEGDSTRRLVRTTAIWFTIGLTALALIMSLAGQFNWIIFYILLSYPILIMAWVEVIYFVKYYDDLEVSSSPAIVSIFALHCVGGITCITQMICTGANYDWYLFIGNLPKVGLALAAVAYTVAFIVMSRRNPLDFVRNDTEAQNRQYNTDRQEQQNRAREQRQQECRNRQEQERKEQERKQREQDNAREELRRKQQKPRDNYEILGISRTATANQIREAFGKKLKMYHPDKHPDPELKKYFTDETEQLIKAYNALISTSK